MMSSSVPGISSASSTSTASGSEAETDAARTDSLSLAAQSSSSSSSAASSLSLAATSASISSVSFTPSLHLILDIDGTLIAEPADSRSNALPVARPYLKEFLHAAFAHFRSVSLWTASSSEWLELVSRRILCPLLPANKQFLFCWSAGKCGRRSHRGELGEGNFYPSRVTVKSLKRVWRSAIGREHGLTRCNTYILDDTPTTYQLNYGNALPIRTWGGHEDEDADEALKELVDRMLEIASRERVRPALVGPRIHSIDVIYAQQPLRTSASSVPSTVAAKTDK